MVEAGIRWTRLDVPFPFHGDERTESAKYQHCRQVIRELADHGIQTLGLTPYPRGWPMSVPPPGSSEFLDLYRRCCAYMAADLGDLVPAWQICNEMNLPYFRRPFECEEQCIPYLVYGGMGVREGHPQAKVGVNMATGHEASAFRMYRQLYPTASVEWDFVGVDAYYGTWEPGGPEDWTDTLDRVHALCGCDIIVMEFGYASAGGQMTDAERGPQEMCSKALHQTSKWPYGWGVGHTPRMQAEYARIAIDRFGQHPAVRGCFWYKWNDGKQCNCGTPGCPENSAYGITDYHQQPKPAWHAFKAAAAPRRSRPDVIDVIQTPAFVDEGCG